MTSATTTGAQRSRLIASIAGVMRDSRWMLPLAAAAGATLSSPAGAQSGACTGWEFVPSPDAVRSPERFATNILYGVGGSAADDVWAVGFFDDGLGPTNTLAMHWNGDAWAIMPTPNPDPGRSVLEDAAAIGPEEAWAVGSFGSESTGMILRWDGSSWDLFEQGPLGVSSLNGIEAIAPDDIWAVGRQPGPALAMHWDGSDWESVSVPKAGSFSDQLQDVSASGPDDVWAVGRSTGGTGVFEPIAAHWDGSSWSSMLVPAPGGNSQLWGVAAVAPGDAWAVGEYFDFVEGTQPLLVHWDGAAWSVVPLPVFPGGPAELLGIAALAPDDIYAAGTDADASGLPHPLIMHYDGSLWQRVEAPGSDGQGEWFRAMAAVPGGQVWAVGQYATGSYTGTLTERFVPQLCCYADCDTSGELDFFDFLCFQDQFAGSASYADCDGSGGHDFFDFLCFQDAFAMGCP